MSDLEAAGAARTIEALRGRGADRFDPVRFRFIEELARRASTHEGATRNILDARLAQLLAAYEEDFERQDRADERSTVPASQGSHRGPLAALLDEVARATPLHEEGPGAKRQEAAAPAVAAELKTLRYFRSTWDGLVTQQRLTDSLTKAPKNAGPLNSQHLVYRALSLMRDVSPGYLNRFVSYVDTLLWLDQSTGGGMLPEATRSAPHPEGEKKAPRRGR